MRARSLTVAASALAAALLAIPVTAPGSSSAAAAPRPVAVPATKPLPRLTFSVPAGGSVLVHGEYPRLHSHCVRPVQPVLHRRFGGRLEVGKDNDGSLFIVAVLSFEDYVRGIAEVPRTWPMDSLKAQAVAARTYALNRMGAPDPEGQRLGYQLCATDACQVYVGLGVSDGPYGDRWRAAVKATAGQALLYEGKPADTMYFSTSNGQTYGNEEVFGGAPVPYLRPVVERDDGASPVSHWRATFPFADLNRFLTAGGEWPGSKITSVHREGPAVVVRGPGARRSIDVASFRSTLDTWSHCLDPDRYPQGLPQAVPSRWFGTSLAGRTLVLTGRGWGHGVGMVQWGARGKAERGLSYPDILAAYYGGLLPQRVDEPDTIRIGIASGLQRVVLAGTGGAVVEGRDVPGPWVVTGGKRLRVSHGGSPPRYIAAGRVVRIPGRARTGRTITAAVTVPELSVVRLVVRSGGNDLAISRPRTFNPGTVRLTGTIPALPSGTYPVEAIVSNGTDIARSPPRFVRVAGVAVTPSPSPTPTPVPLSPSAAISSVRAAPAGPRRSPIPILAVLVTLAVGLAFLGLARRRSGPRD